MAEDLLSFDLPQGKTSIIKVLGVGGGGSNAVNQMFIKGIKDVDFIVCNTDAQALVKSPVPIRIQLGESLTEGRGAGNKPEKGEQAAIENLDDIVNILKQDTGMLFITAGMGGGTGTGAAPVIAKAAKELGILTVGIVTIPFRWEGPVRFNNALEGLHKLRQNVDALLVINNEKLREIYGDLKLSDAFQKADNILVTSAKGIAEIITMHGYINVDFADVVTVMRDSGVVIMGSAQAEGENRAITAIQDALNSPLISNSDLKGAKNILLNITSGIDEITMDEVATITEYVQDVVGQGGSTIIWGTGLDETLENKINVTIIATGFDNEVLPELEIQKPQQKVVNVITSTPTSTSQQTPEVAPSVQEKVEEDTGVVSFTLSDTVPVQPDVRFSMPEMTEEPVVAGSADGGTEDKIARLRQNFNRLKELSAINSDDISEIESEPAYKRLNIDIEEGMPSAEVRLSRLTLNDDNEDKVKISDNNPYLHDNVD